MSQFLDAATMIAKVNRGMEEAEAIANMLTDTINRASQNSITMSDMKDCFNALCHLTKLFTVIQNNVTAQTFLATSLGVTNAQVVNKATDILALLEAAKSTMANDLPHTVDANGQIWWNFVGPDLAGNQQKVFYPNETETASTRVAIQAVLDAM